MIQSICVLSFHFPLGSWECKRNLCSFWEILLVRILGVLLQKSVGVTIFMMLYFFRFLRGLVLVQWQVSSKQNDMPRVCIWESASPLKKLGVICCLPITSRRPCRSESFVHWGQPFLNGAFILSFTLCYRYFKPTASIWTWAKLQFGTQLQFGPVVYLWFS